MADNLKFSDREEVGCPLCDSTIRTANEYGFADQGKVIQCSCGMWYLTPRLSEEEMLKVYASEAYFSGSGDGYSDYAGQEPALRRTFARLLKQLSQRNLLGEKLLEVGCGYGFLIDEASSYCGPRFGTDFSHDAVEKAGEFAEAIWRGGMDAVPETENFDTVIALEVVEHVYDPHQLMEQVKEKLVDGGNFIVAVPDMGSFWRKLMGRHWPSFKLPEHIAYYDADTLCEIFSMHGFTDLKVLHLSHAYPLNEVLKKLGVSFPFMNKLMVWMPRVLVCVSGRRETCL